MHDPSPIIFFIGPTLLERQLDIFAVTESWHHGSEDVPICHAAPPGYSFCDRPRPSSLDGQPARGGGIVVYLRSTLRFSRIVLDMEIIHSRHFVSVLRPLEVR